MKLRKREKDDRQTRKQIKITNVFQKKRKGGEKRDFIISSEVNIFVKFLILENR